MLKETDLSKIKEIAKAMLYIKPKPVPEMPVLIIHPFINSIYYPIENNCIVNILDSEDALNSVLNKIEGDINKSTSYDKIFHMIDKRYKLVFYSLVKDYLSYEDAGKSLVEAWKCIDNPNVSINETLFQKLKMFKEIPREYLMTNREFDFYNKMDENIIIYRGLQGPRTKVKALSWTLDKKQAKWFANRWGENGDLYKAVINKKYILAYFSHENEIIVDYRKLNNIEKIN